MIGIDEVGRGSWAGPLLVVAARQISDLPDGLKDSKVMTKQQRKKILDKLSIACDFGEGWVSPPEIDYHGLAEAMRLGVSRALKAIRVLPIEEIIIDGKVNYVGLPNSKAIINADDLLPIVSAASIYAKVLRDKFMENLARDFPGYGFEKHVGYGTLSHQNAIENHGIIKGVHRLSFKPIKDLA